MKSLVKKHILKQCSRAGSFLQRQFSRVSPRVAKEVLANAFVDEDMRPSDMSAEQCERIIQAFKAVRIMAPSTDCLSPIGEGLVMAGLKSGVEAESGFNAGGDEVHGVGQGPDD